MSVFRNSDITTAGLQMLTNALAGSSIAFTKIVLGSGYTTQSARNIETVVSPVVELEITKCTTSTEGTAVVGSVFSNINLGADFQYRELAVFARSPELGEVIYSYGNAGDDAELIPAAVAGGKNLKEKTIDAIVAIGNAANVTAYINTDAYATVAQVNTAIAASAAAQTTAQGAQQASEQALEQVTIAVAAVAQISTQVAQNTGNIQILWDAIFSDITTNPFSVTFADLIGITLTSGVWNATLKRLEC